MEIFYGYIFLTGLSHFQICLLANSCLAQKSEFFNLATTQQREWHSLDIHRLDGRRLNLTWLWEDGKEDEGCLSIVNRVTPPPLSIFTKSCKFLQEQMSNVLGKQVVTLWPTLCVFFFSFFLFHSPLSLFLSLSVPTLPSLNSSQLVTSFWGH